MKVVSQKIGRSSTGDMFISIGTFEGSIFLQIYRRYHRFAQILYCLEISKVLE
jgi:hypothetical protein